MADELARMVATLEARIAGFERNMAKAAGVADRRASQIENRFVKMNGAIG